MAKPTGKKRLEAGRKGMVERERANRIFLWCGSLEEREKRERERRQAKVAKVSRLRGSEREAMGGMVPMAYSAHNWEGLSNSHTFNTHK